MRQVLVVSLVAAHAQIRVSFRNARFVLREHLQMVELQAASRAARALFRQMQGAHLALRALQASFPIPLDRHFSRSTSRLGETVRLPLLTWPPFLSDQLRARFAQRERTVWWNQVHAKRV